MAGGMSGAEGNGAITRGRVTRANLDVAETFALQDTGVAEVRRHGAVSQVAARSKGANSFYCNNVRLYASGAWGLQPLQLRLAQLQEKTAGAGSIYLTAASGGSGANLLQGAALTPFPKFRRPTGTGMGAVASGTNADGSDIFFRSKIVAGASWDQSASVSTEAHITALTSTLSAIEPSTQPLDILARSNAAQAVDTGFCIRFTLPGTKQHFPDWIAAFAFGQYALLIGGDGELRLWHYAPYLSAPGGASEWRSVLSARYCSPSQVSGNSHCLCIFPHMGESGEKNISILSLNMDASSVSAAGGASTLSPAQGNTGAHTTTEALFTFDGLSTNQVDQGATGQVTTSQRIYLLERRDIRGEWQLSRLSYPVGTSNPAGKLIGQAHAPTTPLALGGVAAEAWTLTKLSREGGAMTITPRLKDSLTQSTTLIDYPYPLFDFYSDGTNTPLLYGYTLVKAATVQTITPGEFATPVKNVQVQLGGQDARNEVAKITIEDPADSWPRLRNRGRLSLRLTTTYTPPGDTQKTITLFRGAVSRPTRTKKGTVNARQGLNGSVRAYPSPEWSEYQCNAAGMWERLSATTLRTALSYELFLSDPAAALGADGSLTAWKVTDVIKRLLSAAGFHAVSSHRGSKGAQFDPRPASGECMDSSRLLTRATMLIFAAGIVGGCGTTAPSGPTLAAGDFAKADAAVATSAPTDTPKPTAAAVPARPAVAKAPQPATPIVEASTSEVIADVGQPITTAPSGPLGGEVLIDAKIGDINNRALYASDFLEPMEAALRAKAFELMKAAKGDTRAVRAAWENYAQEQVGGRLVAFIRDEIFRAEGMSSLKPEQREGLSGYISKLRDEEIRRNDGSLTKTDEEVARLTGGKSLDEYMRSREQTELIRFQLFQQIDRKIQVAWRDIKQQYELSREKYNPNPTAYLRMIVVSAKDEAGIKSITDALASGEDFEKVAERSVNLFNREKGGLIATQFAGAIADATLTNFKPVNAVAVTLAPGSQAGPIDNKETKAWVRFERIEQPSVSLYDAQLGIENELFAQRQERAIQQYLQKLQGRASLSDVETMGLRIMQFARERCLEPVLKGPLASAEATK